MWEKRSNWELATRVPLIIKVPWLAAAAAASSERGAKPTATHSRALVEIVDIYKTAADLMGVPLPAGETVPIDGTSLVPLLTEPGRADFKPYALSMHPRCTHPGMPVYGARGHGQDNSCLDVERTDFTWMGFAMRTQTYRFVQWVAWNGTAQAADWSAVRATELYNHTDDAGAWTDPDRFENVNLAGTVDPAVVAGLAAELREAFREAGGRYY